MLRWSAANPSSASVAMSLISSIPAIGRWTYTGSSLIRMTGVSKTFFPSSHTCKVTDPFSVISLLIPA